MSEIFEELKKIIDPKEPGFITARERWSNFTLGDGISDFLIGCLNETPSPATIEEPVLDKIKKTLSFCEIDNDYGNHQVWMLYLFLRVYQEISSNKSAKPKSKCLPEFNADIFDDNSDVEGFPDYLKQSPYGLEFVKNLARHISGEKTDSKTSVKFPVAFDPNLGTSVNNLKVVVPKFELFKISDESDGLVLHPYNAFTFFDEMFLSIFPLALRKQKSVPGGGVGTVCVRIENYVDEYNKYNFPKLKGNSAGGALVTALLSLKYERIIRNDIALSFAIDENDDLCHKVELYKEKLGMLKNSVNELIVWKSKNETVRTDLEKIGKDKNIKLIFCDTIYDAFSHVTGDTEMILKYLTEFTDMEQKIPLFYKPSNPDGKLKYIDQNVNLKEYKVNRRESFPPPGEQKREDSERIKSSEILAKSTNSNVNVILASSGYGKSFLLINLALEVATASKDDLEKTGDPKVKIPILTSFSDLIKTYDENSDTIKKKYSYSGITEILKFLLSLQDEKLCQKIDSNEVVIFIDSFDDISSDKRKTLLEDLNFFKWLNNQKSPVFFSSRPPFDLEGLSKFNLIELELFGEDSKIEFVKNWFGNPESKNKDNLIFKSPLSSIPLLLFFLCKIPERMQKDMNVVSLVKIYNAIVDQMIKESWRNIQKNDKNDLKVIWENHEKKSGLAEFSYMLFSDERSDIDVGLLIKYKSTEDIIALIQNNPIFVVNGSEEDQQFSFVHKSIQEFLVAFHLAETVNNTGWESMIKYGTKEVEIQTLIDKKAWLPQWEPVIIFMSGLIHDVYKKDLLGIIRGADDIFRHRLSLAARCLPEVLNNFSKD